MVADVDHHDACRFCALGLSHPLYVVLLTDRRSVNNPAMHKSIAWIGVTSNVYCYLERQNRSALYVPGHQLTKAAAGHYQLEMACGPFRRDVTGAPSARRMADHCSKARRKLVNRMCCFTAYAARLARRGVSLYVRDRALVCRYLRASGPPRRRACKRAA